MKIITNDKAYVQYNDITQLMKASVGLSLSIPNSVFDKCFKNIFICDETNRFNFMSFDDNDSIEFFKNLDYIVDYDELKSLSDDEIINVGVSISEERNELCKKYIEMSDEEKKKNGERIPTQCALLDFKMCSVRDVLWFKQGHLKMTLPEGIEDISIGTKSDNLTGIRRLIKSIFKKGKGN